jgi:hypothetical protein
MQSRGQLDCNPVDINIDLGGGVQKICLGQVDVLLKPHFHSNLLWLANFILSACVERQEKSQSRLPDKPLGKVTVTVTVVKSQHPVHIVVCATDISAINSSYQRSQSRQTCQAEVVCLAQLDWLHHTNSKSRVQAPVSSKVLSHLNPAVPAAISEVAAVVPGIFGRWSWSWSGIQLTHISVTCYAATTVVTFSPTMQTVTIGQSCSKCGDKISSRDQVHFNDFHFNELSSFYEEAMQGGKVTP